ncbi:MAG: Smr/MutS family protein [Bacteroidales bacterium]|jgi:DNA mismatch repair protein MutS2|nr:Smr/MutS family protein [Bacteroidales bacterium]
MNLEQKLGFDQIRQSIKMRCSTAYAQRRAETEEMSNNPQTIEKRLALADEMRLVAMFETKFPQGEFTDCTAFLKALEAEFSCISVENLRKLQMFLENLRQVLSFLQNTKEGQYPHLKELASPVQFFPEVSRRIDAILDKNGEIKDNASEELAKIRRELLSTQNSISRKVQSIFKKAQSEGVADEDATISVRDGKLLIPVSTSNKRGLPGLVFDESSSGKTVFVEPLEVVEMNNKVRELHFAEQREIAKILAEFTDFLRPYLIDIQGGARFIGEVDFIRAKAEVAGVMQAGKPIISRDGMLRISNGRHPLLEAALRKENKPIVPMTLEINRKKHILIISGPNAGGKSVCLKTVGILQYMLQWGMLVPCSEVSEFPVFNNIFIDIGDEQSIENDLSTYSSHLMNMRNLLKNADGKSLVLIDEFGAGTEPAAGGAIAETILEELDKRGVYGVITTHYTNLKVYAENSVGAINGAMLFDSARIQPLYKLEIGVPGNSFAFELARKMGLPENIVHQAEEKAGENFVDLERQLRMISKNRRKLDEKLARIKNTDKTLEDVTERYAQELSDIKETKKKIIEQAKEEAQQILASANKKIEATIKEIREAQAEKEKTKEVRENLKKFNESLEQKKDSKQDRKIQAKMEQLIARKRRQEERKERNLQHAVNQGAVGGAAKGAENGKSVGNKKVLTLQTGSKVRIKGSDLIGEVMQIGEKWVSISVGDIISKVKRDTVEVISNKEFEAGHKSVPKPLTHNSLGIDERKLNFKTEIDVRGERLSDALDIVARYIDDAELVGASQVRILHGKGTGVLKEEIRKFLKTLPSVQSCADEDVRFGGSGITIVKMKD